MRWSVDRAFGTKLFYDVRQDIKVDFAEDIFFETSGIAAGAIYSSRFFGKFTASLSANNALNKIKNLVE